MSDLRTALDKIAGQFVSSVLAAMKSASLSDLAGNVAGAAPKRAPGRPPKALAPVSAPAAKAPAKKASKTGKRYRASAEEVAAQKKLAYDTARMLKPGFSKGDVMKKSGSKTDLGRALSLLVAEGRLTKKGDRRKTRYTVK